MRGAGFPSHPIRFDLPPEAGVLFPKCFYFVCVSFLVFCKLLLHYGLSFQNARYSTIRTSAALLLVDTIISGVEVWICEVLFGPTVGANCSYGTKL